MDCIEAIMTRRSIRKYQEAEVPQEDLITILEAGRWAPSAGNYQPCYFVVVDDANKPLFLASQDIHTHKNLLLSILQYSGDWGFH